MRPQAKEYQVGILSHIRPDDKCFDTWAKAGAYAIRLADNYDIIGIWSSPSRRRKSTGDSVRWGGVCEMVVKPIWLCEMGLLDEKEI